jgi:hypothetical protein
VNSYCEWSEEKQQHIAIAKVRIMIKTSGNCYIDCYTKSRKASLLRREEAEPVVEN